MRIKPLCVENGMRVDIGWKTIPDIKFLLKRLDLKRQNYIIIKQEAFNYEVQRLVTRVV
jgi:hypothetical protein